MENLDVQLAANRAYLEGWSVDTRDDPLTYRSGVPHPTLNGVLRVLDADPARAYERARTRLSGVPWIWWVGPDSTPGTAEALIGLGATELVRAPIMAVEADRVADVPTAVSVGVTEDVEEFVTAYARVSGIVPEGVAAAVEREKSFDGRVVRVAGRVEGRIAGTAEIWFSHGLATLYFVGTQPDRRRRGIAAAVTRAAVRLAYERGARTVSLTSSVMAVPLYRALGFHEIGEYRLLTF
ncbi:GNAT family N-acetyltransferase [Actinoplanes sp. NPDC048796]|uniref:GNAT family N-acetyltransferase n=1 Tax=unclassified Actinoplanes TaxID=2626549 RepID=UPI0033E75587